MTELLPTGSWDGRSLAHEGFTFRTDQDLLDRVVPFAEEGLSRDEPVLVVAGERVRTLLAEALGSDVDRLASFTPAETWWRGCHETLHAYDRDLKALHASVPTWRLVAEPVWLGDDDGGQWSRFESVANRSYSELPYYSLCLHDRDRLPAEVFDAVARTHPLRWSGTAPVPTPGYEDPQHFLRSVQPPWHEEPPDAAVAKAITPKEARLAVLSWVPMGWDARVADVVLATHELVTNALRAAAYAELAAWREGDMLVIEVADHGPGLADELAGYVPPADELDGGRGMWLAWSLADDVAVRTGASGTQIRLHFRR